jgi:CRISPR-associated endonuclease Cas1
MATSTEPVRDGRLRRAQAVAGLTDAGLVLARDLIGAKLAGPAAVARSRLGAADPAAALDDLAGTARDASKVELVRRAEAQGASMYWQAWTETTMSFATKDQGRVPAHWRSFDTRRSLTNVSGPRYATDPTNAIVNYLYRLVEVEARFACLTMGLDPLLGVLHVDDRNRDSLPLDLMEPVRPIVDAWVIDLLEQQVFRRSDFHERSDGVVSVLAPTTHQLSETMAMWATALAPWAEQATRVFAETSPYDVAVPTRLTQRNRLSKPSRIPSALPDAGRAELRVARRCADCGVPTKGQRKLCDPCLAAAKVRSAEKAKLRSQAARKRRQATGQSDPTWSREVNQSRSKTMRQQKAERDAWEAEHHGEHWDPADFEPVRLALADIPMSAIMAATGLSRASCVSIRTGRQSCHPRHWAKLADLVGANPPGSR